MGLDIKQSHQSFYCRATDRLISLVLCHNLSEQHHIKIVNISKRTRETPLPLFIAVLEADSQPN